MVLSATTEWWNCCFGIMIINNQEKCNSSARAIHKVAPAVLSRCFAANFVHKMALGSCIDKHKNVQAHFVLFVNAWLNWYRKIIFFEKPIDISDECIYNSQCRKNR